MTTVHELYDQQQESLATLQRKLDFEFENPYLLLQALTPENTYVYDDTAQLWNNKPLEGLGDRLVNLFSAREGFLSNVGSFARDASLPKQKKRPGNAMISQAPGL